MVFTAQTNRKLGANLPNPSFLGKNKSQNFYIISFISINVADKNWLLKAGK